MISDETFLDSIHEETIRRRIVANNINLDEYELIEESFKMDEELVKRISSYELQGYRHIRKEEDSDKYVKPYVITPSGKKYDLPKIYRRLRKLEFGNQHQIEALKVWEFLKLKDIDEYGF